MEIFSREPASGPPLHLDAEEYAASFDAAPVPDFPLRRLLSGVVPQVRSEQVWRDGFALRGFDLDRAELGPGELAFLTLYWRADEPLPDTLVPTVQLRNEAGELAGELPSYCGGVPAETWHATYVNDTAFQIRADDFAPGSYSLHVGVRDLVTGAWLPLAGGGELLELTAVTVR
jgi:hypothetical protein